MIPILFDGNNKEFKSNGLGRLSDCVSCTVTEERNGIFEVEFIYPITGAHYADIDLGKIVVVTHDDRQQKQQFVIYRRSAPINGLVVFNAHHISYLLSNVIIKPFSATSITAAFAGFAQNAMTDNPFAFWTDKTSSGAFTVDVPTSCRALLAGQSGSILDAFGGGDYEFDGYTVKLYKNRGHDSGVTIRYGKNLIDLIAETDTMDLYTAVVPFWKNGEDSVYGGIVYGSGGIRRSAEWTDDNGVVITDENGEPIMFSYAENKVVTMDLSTYFDDAPTAAQLEARAQTILNNNKPWVPKVNAKVDFAALWQTEEYKDIAPLERVRLCDTVTVQYAALGVDVKARVIKTVWNPLLDRYDSIEIGDARMSFADTIMADTEEKLAEVPSTSMMQKAIDHATEQIAGGLGGYIVINRDANGNPIELLIMDTPDKATAVNVWRWNAGGLGHSHTGYDGPFDDVAITQDGQINAAMITVGTMLANMIKGGTLTMGGDENGNGVINVLDASGNIIVVIDKDGITIAEGEINLGDGTFRVTRAGLLYAAGAVLSGTLRNEKGDEWIELIESVIEGGYGSAMDGVLDLSAQYSSGAYRNVVLRALKDHVIIGCPSGKRIELEETGSTSRSAVGSTGTDGAYANDSIKTIYHTAANSLHYMAFAPYSGTTYYAELTTSDEKLKENIEDAKDVGLEVINKIRHKSFDFIEGGNHRDCGYIAQQIREAVPYSTIEAPEHDEAGNLIGNTLQIVDHEILVYATKAIQELSAKVDELERRLKCINIT